MINFAILLLFTVLFASPAFSQLLPKGIGAYQLGYRKFDNNAQYFDESGSARAAGEKLNVDFSAKDMSSGKAGADLKRLYREMKKFDPQGATKGVADDMNFGRLDGEVKTDISAKFLGMAYGLTDKVTVFGGVPFVSARIDAQIHYSGSNNAQSIKKRLGNMIYKEMQDGLDTASKLTVDSVREDIEVNKGYGPIDHWEYNGLGDMLLGARTEIDGSQFGMKRFKLGLSSQLDLATGHSDDPDILIDIPIGRGYHALTIAADGKVSTHGFDAGLQGSLTQGLNRDISKRVTDGEEVLASADRKVNVHWQPGQDIGGAMYLGFGNTLVKGTYSLGAAKHLRDRFSGPIDGDYATMEKETESSKTYHQIALTVSTVDAYSKKDFAVPFVMSLVVHDTFAGENAPREKYIELSIASFFSTPAAATPRNAIGDKAAKNSKSFAAN